jgi:hypothetical protein
MSVRLSARIAAAVVAAPLAVTFLAGPAAAQGGKPTKPAKTETVATTDGAGSDGFSLNGETTDDSSADGFSLN